MLRRLLIDDSLFKGNLLITDCAWGDQIYSLANRECAFSLYIACGETDLF